MSTINSPADARAALKRMVKAIAPPAGRYPLDGGPHTLEHMAVNAVCQFAFAEIARRHDDADDFEEFINQALAWALDVLDLMDREAGRG